MKAIEKILCCTSIIAVVAVAVCKKQMEVPVADKNKSNPPDMSAREAYIWPAQGELTSGYGMRWGRMHKGIDIAGPIGTPIFAAAEGIVICATWDDGYGKFLELEHDGSLTLYAHNDSLLVKKGERVKQGQLIAYMGSTGRSTGFHLHFEIIIPKKGEVDPLPLLPSNSSLSKIPEED